MASLPNRQFVASAAQREHVPLLIGLTGPSGGGKTFSALRLATGIQTVTGGDIYFIDTESRRALHYADRFKFKHVPFAAPFGSLDYLAALKFCVDQGAKVIIVDSLSHEHEGPGGMVDLHDQIVDRMAGNDFAKRERVKMLAWSEPKQKRRALINGILQLNANFIFCFRAKNTSKPVKNKQTGKNEVEQMGFMPIAGEEFVFEQTLNALLLPGAGGVPTWHSDQIGERTMIKLPEQFAALRDRNKPLDESVGKRLAMWAAGSPAIVKTKDDERSFEANDTQPSSPDPLPVGEDAGPTTAAVDEEEQPHVSEHEEAGEAFTDNHPARDTADKIISASKIVRDEKGLENIRSKHAADIAAMPEELAAEVEQAMAKAGERVKGEG